jgi:hypothetical protein
VRPRRQVFAAFAGVGWWSVRGSKAFSTGFCPAITIELLVEIGCKHLCLPRMLDGHARLNRMDGSQSTKPKRPILVSLGLWGLKTRKAALAFMWLCIAAAVVSAALKFWLGLIMLVAALWYWYALTWVDKHEGWK